MYVNRAEITELLSEYGGFLEGMELDSKSAFLIDSVIHQGSTMIFGEPKIGKSLVALSAAMAIADGTEWLGRKVEKKRAGFMALDPNQKDETVRRYKAYRDLDGRKTDLILFHKRPDGTEQWWDDFIDAVDVAGIEVLFIDNLNRMLGSERTYNNDPDVRYVTDGILQRLLDRGIAVILLHHAGKYSEEKGSQTTPMGATTIGAYFRLIVQVLSDSADLTILRPYGNDVGKDLEIGVVLDPMVSGEDGAFITLINETEEEPADERQVNRKAQAEKDWDARVSRQAKQGRSRGSRKNRGRAKADPVIEQVPDAIRAWDVGQRVSNWISDPERSGQWHKLGTIQHSVQGHNNAISGALDSLTNRGDVEFKQDGRSKLYRWVG